MARARKRPVARPSRDAPARPAVRGVSTATTPVELREDPHAHIVCRSCGRIQRIELTELDRHFLTELASRRPAGWMVDGISFSLTGACQRCREGPSA